MIEKYHIKVQRKMKTKNKRNYLKERGITLIALVVTILILLILAGITINMLFGENGILARAKNADNTMKNAQQKDLDELDRLSNWIDEKTNTSNGDSTGGDDKPPTNELPYTTTTNPYYPDSTFTKVEGTDLSKGLVIQDENKNQYVWIEVPKTTKVYKTAGLAITEFTADEYTKIETDLHTYTDYYRRYNTSGTLTSYKDAYFSKATTGLTSADYTVLKQKMLKSVYKNGGFWIGRYEAGIATKRASKDEAITATPLSKKGTTAATVYPYNYVTCSQAQTLAQKLSEGKEYTSSLMFGVQWDLVLKHIEVKEVANGTSLSAIQSALRGNSSSWGNYDSDVILTGSNEKYKKINIYDLAGNVSEWTLEYTADTGYPCAFRGGYFNNCNFPASRRNISYTTDSIVQIGFRASLYK